MRQIVTIEMVDNGFIVHNKPKVEKVDQINTFLDMIPTILNSISMAMPVEEEEPEDVPTNETKVFKNYNSLEAYLKYNLNPPKE